MMKGIAKLRTTDYVIFNDPPLLPSTNSGPGGVPTLHVVPAQTASNVLW